jgi:hypothetical protein
MARARIFAGLATCALACGATTAVAPAAGGATTECGSSCSTWMVYEYSPDLVLNSTGDEQGSIVTLAEKGEHVGEDFVLPSAATTTEYYQYGIIAAPLAEEWPISDWIPDGTFMPDGNLAVGFGLPGSRRAFMFRLNQARESRKADCVHFDRLRAFCPRAAPRGAACSELPEFCHPIRLYCREDRDHGPAVPERKWW